MKRRPTALLFSVLSLSSMTASAGDAHWQQPSYIENSFVTIALGREHGRASGRLSKWASAIRFTITDYTADKVLHQQMTRQHLSHLASITGLDIKQAQSHNKSNLSIIFASENELDERMQHDFGIHSEALRLRLSRGAVCFAWLPSTAEAISHARVIIPVDRARAHGKLMACVVEELTQVLGLANDSDAVFPSVFNDHSHNDFLTGLDFVLLKLMYHPDLRSGMTEQQVRQTVQQILSESEFQQLLHDAERKVRLHSLENWLD
jgi:hypothetical protein